MNRRTLILAAVCAPILALPGCATTSGSYSPVEAIRRLLVLSSERAFERLLAPDGFLNDQLAAITLPPSLGGEGGGAMLSVLLRSEPIRRRLLRQVNYAAQDAADAAAPILFDAIRGLTIADALALVRGGSGAATALLEARMGDRLIDAMLPEVGAALRIADSAIVTEALRIATGIDIAGLTSDITGKASRGIFRAIAREEAAIRADPASTRDPLLIAIFGLR